MIQKKAISPLIASILLIVIAVVLISVVLSWSSAFFNKEVKSNPFILEKKSNQPLLIYPDTILKNNLVLKNLSSKDITIVSYKIINDENIGSLNQYIDFNGDSLEISKNQVGLISLPCTPKRKFTVELVLVNGEYVSVPVTSSFYNINECYPQGSLQNPFVLSSVDDFNLLIDNLDLNYYFSLSNDIDFSSYNQGEGFQTIGSPEQPFVGVLDGKGYSIKNLYINRPNDSNVSFINNISPDSVIKNLNFQDVNIIGLEEVSVLSILNQGTIENVSITGYVTLKVTFNCGMFGCISFGGASGSSLTNTNIGVISNSSFDGNISGVSISGFVYNNFGVIQDSSVSGNLNSSLSVSGFVYNNGDNSFDGNIYRSLFSGNIYILVSQEGSNVSGFVNDFYSGIISDSYAVGEIINSASFGFIRGFVNFFNSPNPKLIINSYSSMVNSDIGFGGDNAQEGEIVNSYYNSDVSGIFENGIPKTSSQLKDQATFIGWDFIDVWTINQGVSFPSLR